MLAWRLSNTLDTDFCVAALEEALSKRRSEYFNTDQGSQFTSEAVTGLRNRRVTGSAWTAMDAAWTISSWSASGAW